MRFRAIALSVLAHFALLAAVAWRMFTPAPHSELVIQAPLGDVFAEEVRGAAAPAAPAPAAEPGHAPGALQVTAVGGAPAPSGLPEGEAKPVGEIRPGYPPLSRKLGEEGEAMFTLRIAPSGQVEDASLEKSSGHERLDAAARTALLAARFQNENGTALVKRFRVEFRLNSAR